MKRILIIIIIFFILMIKTVLSQKNNDSTNTDTIGLHELKEVIITGTYVPKIINETPGIVTVISRKDIEQLNPHSLNDMLMLVTGLNIETGTGSGLPDRAIISMNGFPANYTLILIDGVQLLTDHIQTGQNIDLIPVENIERIEVIKEASSAQYGNNAMSGIVNIITRKCCKSNEVNLYGSAGSFNSYQAGLGLQNKINEKIGTSLFFNWEKSDGAPIKYPKHRIGFLNYNMANLMGSIAIHFSSKINSSLDINLASNKMNWAGSYKHSWLITAILDNKFDLSDKVSLTIKIPFSQWNSEQNLENIFLTRPQVFVTWTEKDRNFLTGGFDYSNNSFKRTAVEIHTQSNIGAFVQDDFKIIKNFTISGAVRADKTDNLNIVISPKFSFVYYPVSYLGFRGSIGRAFHAPSVQEKYEVGYGHGGAALRFGNPDLKPEHSTTYNLLAEIYPIENIQFVINGFYSNIENMVVPIYAGAWSQDTSKDMWVRQNIYKAIIYGLEITSRFNFFKNKLLIEAGYVYNYNRNHDTKNILPYYPGSSINGRINFNSNIGHNIIFSVFATINAINNRSAWSWQPAPNSNYNDLNGLVTVLKNYQLLNAGVSITIFKNYEFFFNAKNILKQEIENLDDAFTVFYGTTSFDGGFKIRLQKS